MNAQLDDIDDIIIAYTNHDGLLVEALNYPGDNIPDVITDGITFAKNIPLSNVIGDEVQVRVTTVANRAVNSPSNAFTTIQCGAALDSTDKFAGSSYNICRDIV